MNIRPVPFCNVSIASRFWSPVIERITATTVRVCLDRCEETGRLDNFRKAAGRMEGEFKGIFFDDSDVYKVLEGAAYCLMHCRDEALEARVDGIIDDICAAQQPDGYLNTYTMHNPEKRWTDMSMHEDYCIGHLAEAAVAYHQATGKDALLKCAIRAVEHMMSLFGPDKRHWVVGHEEPELALVRLWRHTGDKRFLDYCKWLLSERGHGHMVSDHFEKLSFMGAYAQDDVPVEDVRKVVGHAVRAMYLYSAMADIAGIEQPSHYNEALHALWRDVADGNLYITGGIGQSSDNEGFTRAFHKPNLTAYCESCAAIGMAFWNHRMSLLEVDGCYADMVEKELYNGALAGMSLSGDRFFYENPLASIGRHHRSPWFNCSCCPSNLVRFLPSVGGYCYVADDESIYINQYIASALDMTDDRGSASLTVETDYPWDGRIVIRVHHLTNRSCLRLRIPGWCRHWQLAGGEAVPFGKGYVSVAVSEGSVLTLDLTMPIERVYEDERVLEDRGRVCVMRGPVVYCAESADNPGIPLEYFHADCALRKAADIVIDGRDERLCHALTLRADILRLIPYYLWDNREPGAMSVWLKETE